MKKFLKIFLGVLLTGLIGVALALVFLQPEIFTRKGKAVVKTNTTSLYIPSVQPVEVYAFDPNDQRLNQILENDTKNVDASFGIYVKNLNTKQEATLNADQKFTAASLYKLFVMYVIYEKASEGKLDINNQDVQKNLEAMITVSSNDASLYLVERYTSWQEVTDKMHDLGLKNTDLTTEDLVTTPSDVAKLLELIADGKAVNFDASVAMLKLMTDQTRRDRIPEPLPDDALVANKTGELDDVLHDAAVVGTDKSDYIIVLMSKESKSLNTTRMTMRKISEDIYNYFN